MLQTLCYTQYSIWQICHIASKAIYCEHEEMRRQTLYTSGVVGGKTNHIEYVKHRNCVTSRISDLI